jgi:hypothetical protein
LFAGSNDVTTVSADEACSLPDLERLSVPHPFRDLECMRIITRLYVGRFRDLIVIVQYVQAIVSHDLLHELHEANDTRTGRLLTLQCMAMRSACHWPIQAI